MDLILFTIIVYVASIFSAFMVDDWEQKCKDNKEKYLKLKKNFDLVGLSS
jgi:hypothetical protein